MSELDNVFNIVPNEPSLPAIKDPYDASLVVSMDDTTKVNVEANINEDYVNTRTNLYNLLNTGQSALLDALEVARGSEHPRAFEVVGNLIKQLADINHQLLDLSEKKQKMVTKKDEPINPTTVNNNAIFVGSTSELSKMLKNINE